MNTKLESTPSVTHEAGQGNVLSIYLNVDQSYAPNRHQGFEVVLKEKLREIEDRLADPGDLAAFRQATVVATAAVDAQKPGSGTVVVFVRADGSVRSRQLLVPIDTEVRWLNHPYLQPMLAAEDEFKPVVMVIIDHQHARFFTSVFGHVTEQPGLENTHQSKHTKSAGKDHIKSQTVFNRKSDEQVTHFLKDVAGATQSLFVGYSSSRLILAGNDETRRELHSLLPRPLRERVVASIPLPIASRTSQIHEAMETIGVRAEREAESVKVNSLLELAGPHSKGVVGFTDTLSALKHGRIREFVYSEGLAFTGARCNSCDSFFLTGLVCPTCQTALDPIHDAVDFAIEAALNTGAKVEQVRGAAAEKLRTVDGLGGFLR